MTLTKMIVMVAAIGIGATTFLTTLAAAGLGDFSGETGPGTSTGPTQAISSTPSVPATAWRTDDYGKRHQLRQDQPDGSGRRGDNHLRQPGFDASQPRHPRWIECRRRVAGKDEDPDRSRQEHAFRHTPAGKVLLPVRCAPRPDARNPHGDWITGRLVQAVGDVLFEAGVDHVRWNLEFELVTHDRPERGEFGSVVPALGIPEIRAYDALRAVEE